LRALAGDGPVTFQTYTDRNAPRPDPLARKPHGTLAQHHKALEALNARGAGVYVMVNEGDGKGRSAVNVTRIRSLFVDTDGAPYPDPLPLAPHIVVQSSPGRWHVYWLVYGLELAEFAPLQKALADLHGTDPSVNDLPRVMRLPGYLHCKGEPVRVELLEAHDRAPYSRAEVLSACPNLAERLERARVEAAERELKRAAVLARAAERKANPTTDTSNRAKALLQGHHDAVATAGDGARHLTLRNSARALGGYIAGGVLEYADALDILTAAAKVCELPDGEAQDAIRWGLKAGADKPLEFEERDTGGRITLLSGKPKAPKPKSYRARVYARMRGPARGA
jgi:hypothetical protein